MGIEKLDLFTGYGICEWSWLKTHGGRKTPVTGFATKYKCKKKKNESKEDKSLDDALHNYGNTIPKWFFLYIYFFFKFSIFCFDIFFYFIYCTVYSRYRNSLVVPQIVIERRWKTRRYIYKYFRNSLVGKVIRWVQIIIIIIFD